MSLAMSEIASTPGSLQVALRSRGAQLVLLTVAMGIAGYARTAMSPLQEAIRVSLALTDNQMALLQGPAVGIPAVLTAIPLGILIDRYMRIRLLWLMIGLATAGSLITAVASGFEALLLARGLTGTTALAILPIVFSLLSDHYPAHQRGRATTAAIVGQVAGNSMAFALGGQLLANGAAAADGWRAAMLWLATPLFPMGLLLMPMLREPVRSDVLIPNATVRQTWAELRVYRATIWPLVSGIVLMEVAIGAMIVWAAPMLTRNYSLSPDRVGALMGAAMLVSGILGPAIGGPLADRCQTKGGPRRSVTVLATLALLTVPVSLFALAPGALASTALVVCSMSLMLAAVVMGMALFTVVVPNEVRGLCMSVLVALEVLFALAAGPPVVSLLSSVIGGIPAVGVALTIVCCTANLFAALAFAVARRSLPLNGRETAKG